MAGYLPAAAAERAAQYAALGPVSYTHLDVYKRQHQDTCKRENDQQELAEPFHTW